MRAILLVPAVLLAAACSSTIVLHETTPVSVSARRPALPEPPPEPPPPVVVERDRIRVDQRINFALDSATILEDSFGILDEVARVISEHAELRVIRVEGHTDQRERSSADYNRRLSQRRAESVVRYLVEHGVERDRLVPEGFGFDRPIASNADEGGRAQNRRVEFNIVEQDEPQGE